ncbi:carboxylesterase/lipase family protein [Sediminibacterium soli]|uniref:carboxylesterase/lipase family protein n=1 Tax=Sediminibacterium soli TaxID=2698829 RepID=UPI0013799CE9|nr:carboxylesterase family protein [Sediminibacterium soli]NCI46220.1 carboxylesterase family protein [Sediminibacterium soli]
MKKHLFASFALSLSLYAAIAQHPQVRIANGLLEGGMEKSGIRSFKGIPFAQPPVGDLRWKEPQPVANWQGVRKADHFGNNPMQKPIFGDMRFRSAGMSEDCLYLNVWTPATSAKEKLPVLVYFYGGGLMAGDGSEGRYDGESMAKKGIVALTVNYRLGVFGFFAHPELTKESPHHSSSNYGYLDQHAALQWVQKNIAAFGGDPKKVTIAGESAGSISVSVQMASPLSRGLIAGAIGESGAAINPTLAPIPLADGEKNGLAFAAAKTTAKSLAELRAIPADKLLEAAAAFTPGSPAMSATIDGYLLPKSLPEIFMAGEQARVPLMAGWNSAEVPYQFVMRADEPTPENYRKAVKQLYGARAEEVMQLYPGNTKEEAIRSATALSSDRFIVYSTWKWADMHSQTGGKPVYRYLFSKLKPSAAPQTPGVFRGAAHASEIEYAMGNLASDPAVKWTEEDRKVSEIMEAYFANFIKTGNPNAAGLPEWPAITKGSKVNFINIDTETKAEAEQDRKRYLFLDQVYMKK